MINTELFHSLVSCNILRLEHNLFYATEQTVRLSIFSVFQATEFLVLRVKGKNLHKNLSIRRTIRQNFRLKPSLCLTSCSLSPSFRPTSLCIFAAAGAEVTRRNQHFSNSRTKKWTLIYVGRCVGIICHRNG